MATAVGSKVKGSRINSAGTRITRGLAYIEDHSTRILVALFVLSILAFLITIPLPHSDGKLIGSDGVFYYMYVRSLGIDHDISFANEYAVLCPTFDLSKLQTSTGYYANPYAVGPALLWLPFFFAGHLISLVLRAIGLSVPTDGYSYIYQAAVCIGSIFYGFGAMFLMHRTTRRLLPNTAMIACILLWLSTNYIYYQIVEPSMSHMCSLFVTSLLIYAWLATRPIDSLRQLYILGLIGGLVGLVRQPDATLLALPLLAAMFVRRPLAEQGKRIAVAIAGFFSVFWIQMFVWNTLNGSPFLSGYFLADESFANGWMGDTGFSWFSPHLLEVLFSTQHGLFFWHPILLLAAVGLVLLLREAPLTGGLFLAGFFGQAYLIASWASWSQGHAFGGRMFIAAYPILVIGLAAFLQHTRKRSHLALTSYAVGGVLVLWNALFIIQYKLGYISPFGPYTIHELTLGKAEMIIDVVNRFLH